MQRDSRNHLSPPRLAARRIVAVVGKGGVGRSVVSAALATALARRDRRVLVTMFNTRERLSGIFEAPKVGPEIAPIRPGIDAVNLQPEASMSEFGAMKLRSRALYRLVFENRLVRPFLAGIPGMAAWALIGKATWHALETDADGRPRWDTVILDAPATGHAVATFGLPRTIARIVPVGPLHRDADERAELLCDPERTVALPVARLEEIVVTETAELVSKLREAAGMRAAAVAVNAVSPVRFDPEEFERAGVGGNGTIAAVLRTARALAEREDAQRRRLDELLGLPTVDLPLLEGGRIRLAEVERLADCLEPLL